MSEKVDYPWISESLIKVAEEKLVKARNSSEDSWVSHVLIGDGTSFGSALCKKSGGSNKNNFWGVNCADCLELLIREAQVRYRIKSFADKIVDRVRLNCFHPQNKVSDMAEFDVAELLESDITVETVCDQVFSEYAQLQGPERQRAMLVGALDGLLAKAWDVGRGSASYMSEPSDNPYRGVIHTTLTNK